MKKIISIILFLFLVLGLLKANYWEQYKEEVIYDINENESLDNISVDIQNATLNIVSTKNNKIKIDRTTTKAGEETVEYTSNLYSGDFVLSKFAKKGNKKNNYKDVIDIEIPEDYLLENIKFNLENSNVLVNNVNVSNLEVNSIGNSSFFISNSEIGKANINGEYLENTISNSLIKEEINYKINTGTITNQNTTGLVENIENKGNLIYNNETSFFDNTNFISKNVSLNYVLSENKNYYFQEVNNALKNSFLSREGRSYKYKGTDSIERYNVAVNGNNIDSIKVDKLKVQEEE